MVARAYQKVPEIRFCDTCKRFVEPGPNENLRMYSYAKAKYCSRDCFYNRKRKTNPAIATTNTKGKGVQRGKE